MIATMRGIAVLAALAVALLVVVVAVGRRDHPVEDRSLWPGFDDADVQHIAFGRGGRNPIQLTRSGDTWRVDGSSATVATEPLDALFTAMRGGRWHRRAPASAAGVPSLPHDIIRTTVGDTSFVFGERVPGTDQTWIVRERDGERVGLLVDSWIVRALTPDALALRVRHPVECAGAREITATLGDATVRIEHGRLAEPHAMWLDEQFLARLAAVCARLEIVALHGTRADSPGLRIASDGSTLAEVGTCEGGRVFVDTSTGAGCVEAAALDAVRDTLAELARPADTAMDRRPLPIDPVTLTLADGSVLDVAKLRLGDADADPDAVRELLGALTTRGETAIPRPPARKPRATLRATDRAGTEVILEIIDDAIGRAGEPSLIRVAPHDLAIITRPSAALRDATRWREDATTLSSLTLDGITYRRGAVLGEWTREPAGTFDAALVDALVETLATVRAPAAAPPRAIRHRLALTFTPPAGQPTTHAIELAPPASGGCPGRVDGTPVRLPLPLCTAALALASSR